MQKDKKTKRQKGRKTKITNRQKKTKKNTHKKQGARRAPMPSTGARISYSRL